MTIKDWWTKYIEKRTYADVPGSEEYKMSKSYASEWAMSGYINHGDAFEDGCINWFRKSK